MKMLFGSNNIYNNNNSSGNRSSVSASNKNILIPASDKSFLIEASQQLHSNYSEGNNYQSQAHTFSLDMDE